MTYSFVVTPIDSTGRFTLIDRSVRNSTAIWAPSVNGIEMLVGSDSGASGCLRYKSTAGEHFVVIVGIHAYKPWIGIATDLTPQEETSAVNQEWYGKGKRNQNWVQVIEMQQTSKSGTLVDLRILSQNGNQYNAELNIVDA